MVLPVLTSDRMVQLILTVYRSITGALQYLTSTRPDLAFAVNQACQHMRSPTVAHFTALKRILRYLEGTLSHGILFKQGPLVLTAYSDADWAGDPPIGLVIRWTDVPL